MNVKEVSMDLVWIYKTHIEFVGLDVYVTLTRDMVKSCEAGELLSSEGASHGTKGTFSCEYLEFHFRLYSALKQFLADFHTIRNLSRRLNNNFLKSN